jgi:hypothetical protein
VFDRLREWAGALGFPQLESLGLGTAVALRSDQAQVVSYRELPFDASVRRRTDGRLILELGELPDRLRTLFATFPQAVDAPIEWTSRQPAVAHGSAEDGWAEFELGRSDLSLGDLAEQLSELELFAG